MSGPIEILSRIRQSGGSVRVADGDLQISAPGGTLSPEDRLVLASHKPDLVRLLNPVDEEKAAVRWVESLSDADAETIVETARREWSEIVDEPGTDSIYTKIERTVEESFAEFGVEVEARFQAGTHNRWLDDPEGPDEVLPGEPCLNCSSLEFWENHLGDRFCQQCRPVCRSEAIVKAINLPNSAEEVEASRSVGLEMQLRIPCI